MKKSEILEQLFDKDRVETTVILFKNKSGEFKVKFKTLSGQDYLDIEQFVENIKGTKMYIMQKYGIEKLKRCIIRYKGSKVETIEQAEEIISKLSAHMLDKILQEHNKFEKEVRNAIGVEEIEKNFFNKADSSIKQKHSQKGSTSESREASENQSYSDTAKKTN